MADVEPRLEADIRHDLRRRMPNEPRRVELPAYGRLDVAAAVTLLDAGSGGVVLHARVENALDRRYEEVLHFPARGRTVWIGASYRGSD